MPYAAVLFLYKEILNRVLDWLDDVTRAKRSQRVLRVLTCTAHVPSGWQPATSSVVI